MWHRILFSPLSGLLQLALDAGHVVVVPGGEPIRQLVHDVPVDDGVEVLAEHVQEEPVADLAAPHYRLHGLAPHQPKPQPQQVDPRSRREDYYDLPIERNACKYYSQGGYFEDYTDVRGMKLKSLC